MRAISPSPLTKSNTSVLYIYLTIQLQPSNTLGRYSATLQSTRIISTLFPGFITLNMIKFEVLCARDLQENLININNNNNNNNNDNNNNNNNNNNNDDDDDDDNDNNFQQQFSISETPLYVVHSLNL